MHECATYLGFDGNCAEAMRFYERVLNGKLVMLLKNGESPMADQIPAEDADRIMHARLEFHGQVLMAGDAPRDAGYQGMSGFCVALGYPTEAEARRVFDALAEGGKVNMPFGRSFWAEGFGMLIDRFGTPWILNGGSIPFEQPAR